MKCFPGKCCSSTAWRGQDEEKIETFSISWADTLRNNTNLPFTPGAGFESCIFLCFRSCSLRADLETSVTAASVFSWPNCPGVWWVEATSTNRSQKHLFLCSSQISVEMSSWAGKLGCPGQSSGSDLRWHFNPGQEQFVPGHNIHLNWFLLKTCGGFRSQIRYSTKGLRELDVYLKLYSCIALHTATVTHKHFPSKGLSPSVRQGKACTGKKSFLSACISDAIMSFQGLRTVIQET